MSNGKHYSSEEQRVMAPKPVVPMKGGRTANRTRAAHGTHSTNNATGSSRRTTVSLKTPRGPRKLRPAAIVALAAALVAVAVAGVTAWTTAQDALTNQFEIGEVNTDIVESFGNNVKENVYVTNKESNVPVYVRAQVNIYWIDAKTREQLWYAPQMNENYSVDGNIPANGNGWFEDTSTGFYYWKNPVSAGGQTGQLIKKIFQSEDQLNADKAAGRKLVVDVDIQSIQANPTDAVKDAWQMDVDADGTLSVNGQGA